MQKNCIILLVAFQTVKSRNVAFLAVKIFVGKNKII